MLSTVPVVRPCRLSRSITVSARRSRGRSRVRISPVARSNTVLAGTPLRSGRTPVIIITWFGMVSMTGMEEARGSRSPLPRSAARFGVRPLSISSGRHPSITSAYARLRTRDAAAAGAVAARLEKSRPAPPALRRVRRPVRTAARPSANAVDIAVDIAVDRVGSHISDHPPDA